MIRFLTTGISGVVCGAMGIVAMGQEDFDLKWGSVFRESYQDTATGRAVSFLVKTPPKPANPATKLPLIVALKGGPKVTPSAEFPFIEVRPTGGGIWGYRSMSAVDVMSVIAAMKKKYPVDPNRVSLVGFSAGASGAMHLASLYPDQFSAVVAMVAAGNDYPIRNFSNLPLAIHHGDRDWTSAICDARVQFQKMQAAGNQLAILKEYPGVGHSVPANEHVSIVKWMLEQKLDPAPKSITIDCETPTLGRHAYLQILEFNDPHQRAFLAATFESGQLNIQTKNIAALMIQSGVLPELKTVQMGEQTFAVTQEADVIGLKRTAETWEIESNFSLQRSPKRAYEAGAAANLYQGEPLLIVYGTGNLARRLQLQTAAEMLAKCGGPPNALLKHTQFSVVADSDLTPEQEATSNLILVGCSDENSATAKVLDKLPIQISDGKLKAGNREALALEGQVLSLLHFNPQHPEHLVYLIAPFCDEGLKEPARFLAGSDGFHRIEQPDLIVQNLENEIAREMQFDKQWEWISYEGEATKVPDGFNNRDQLALSYLKIMAEKSGADFAMWWGPADQGMWGMDFNYLEKYQPEFYSFADLKTKKRVLETVTGGVSGADLKIISDRWVSKKEITVFPKLDLNSIDPTTSYRIHIPMDLYIKLGQRKKNLIDPQPGPEISPDDLIRELSK